MSDAVLPEACSWETTESLCVLRPAFVGSSALSSLFVCERAARSVSYGKTCHNKEDTWRTVAVERLCCITDTFSNAFCSVSPLLNGSNSMMARNSTPVRPMEPEDSSPCLQKSAVGPYPEPDVATTKHHDIHIKTYFNTSFAVYPPNHSRVKNGLKLATTSYCQIVNRWTNVILFLSQLTI